MRVFENREVRSLFWTVIMACVGVVAILALESKIAQGQCFGGNCPSGQCPSVRQRESSKSIVRKPAAQPRREKADKQPRPAWRYEEPKGHRRSVVRVYCKDTERVRSIGSGVAVKYNGRVVVLTARHVIEDAKSITIELPTKQTRRVRVLKVDVVWDCAVLEVLGDTAGIEVAEIEWGNAAMQVEGNRLESCGYGPDGKLAVNSGLFIGYRRSSNKPDTPPDDWFTMSGPARQGDSGGPIFNERGRVVGILWGTNGEIVVGVQAGRVHRVLTEAVAVKQQSFRQTAYEPDRQPTPPMPGPVISIDDLPDASVDQVAEQERSSLLRWRREQEAKVDSIAEGQRAIGQKLDNLANRPPQQATDPELQRRLDALTQSIAADKAEREAEAAKEAAKPKTPGEKIKADIAERKEKGFAKRLRDNMDDADFSIGLFVVAVVVSVLTFVALRKGKGIHARVETDRAKWVDASDDGGLRGYVATKVLAAHDGDLGKRLADLEAKLVKPTAATPTATPVA